MPPSGFPRHQLWAIALVGAYIYCISPLRLSITHISGRSDFGAEFDISESG
jgi:hypothetical protein